jgi:hypothetical protein
MDVDNICLWTTHVDVEHTYTATDMDVGNTCAAAAHLVCSKLHLAGIGVAAAEQDGQVLRGQPI